MKHELFNVHHFFASLPALASIVFVAPFLFLLLSIAILPRLAPGFWKRDRNKAITSMVFGLPATVFFLIYDWSVMARTMLEYGAFISLLGALFIISGGIYIRGSFKGSPLVNTIFLGLGAALANIIGTTGASMLLIRPLIRANHKRHDKVHTVIFFIFIVSNCGGILTPLGDPPLFLGFLRGVDFLWTLRLLPQFLFVIISLLGIYFLVDRSYFNREMNRRMQQAVLEEPILSERFGIDGWRNLFLLVPVIAVSLFAGNVLYKLEGHPVFDDSFGSVLSKSVQILAFTTLAVISYVLTPKRYHERNELHFSPIIEVAILFAGIFAAMAPALMILETRGEMFGVNRPWQFFWLTGTLSSFLDNAPAYLAFTSLAKGVLNITTEGMCGLMSHTIGQRYLAAVSCGAVFMGAITYIGNGPNFMVKAIAEHHKVKMPSFFHYMLWSLVVFVPLFIVLTFIFFR